MRVVIFKLARFRAQVTDASRVAAALQATVFIIHKAPH